MKTDLISAIQEPIKDCINEFELVYKKTLESDVSIINTIIKYITKTKGKQIRPTLCLLAAKLCGDPTENTYKAAALIEIIHVATLCHDDVIDDATIRRGWPSINKIWKNKLSILIGDYMFSKSLSNMIDIDDFAAMRIFSNTATRLSQGEILQIEKVKKKNMNEDLYYKMISDKTASLFSASCELGCITVGKNDKFQNALSDFGEKLGLVFQIRDDLLDIIGSESTLGKSTVFDLKKNMQTLPMIYILSKLNKLDRFQLIRSLRHHIKYSEKKKIKNLIISLGGVDYAKQKIQQFSEEAKQHLSCFNDSIYKEAMFSLLDFNFNRMQ